MEYLQEGSSQRMGVMKLEEPRYRGKCRMCPWKGAEHRSDSDAADELYMHVQTPEHHEAVLRKLVRDHVDFDFYEAGVGYVP